MGPWLKNILLIAIWPILQLLHVCLSNPIREVMRKWIDDNAIVNAVMNRRGSVVLSQSTTDSSFVRAERAPTYCESDVLDR